MANSIIAGNDFRLIIRAKKSTGAYLADMDLADVEDLRIYLTRAGRSKVLQSYTLDDEGHAVIYVSAGVVTNATYGIEMVGVYGGARLRAHNTSVFTISGHGGGNSGVLNDYYADIVFVINVAATDVYVQNAIEAHNEDEASHPHLLQLIEEAGNVDDVRIDGESIVDGNKIANINSSQFGKVDDVKVNGTSVVSNKEANITIPEKVSDLPNDAEYATRSELTTGLDAKQDTITAVAEPTIADDGGNPSASVDFEGGEMAFAFKNLKLRFSDLTAADKAELKGDKGDQGDSVLVGQGDLPLAHVLGQDNTKAISQKGVTDAFGNLGLRRITFTDGDFALVDGLGNILVLCSNGHIKVKNFDSSTINLHIVGDSGADFDVADDDGNVIFRVAGGYVFTKNFSGFDVISRLNELEKETGKPDTFYYLKGMSKKDYAAPKKIGIIVAGQSNARGATREAMPSALSASLPITNCHFVENLAYTQESYDNAPFEEFYPFSYSHEGRYLSDRWGFDAQLYYDIAVTDEQDMYVIKTAQGDTSIAPDGYGNGHWTADYENVSSGIKLIREFEKNIKQHVEDYGDNFDIRALVWHQGEGDRDKGADYYNNLKNFIDYVRGVVGNNQLPVIIGGISHLSSQWTKAVEDAQIRLTEEDPNIYLIDMSGAPLQTYDTFHFNSASCVYLGHMVHNLLVDLGIVDGSKIEPTRPW